MKTIPAATCTLYAVFGLLGLHCSLCSHSLDTNAVPLICHEFMISEFRNDPAKTEFAAYTLLKKKKFNKQINYLVVPWHVLQRNFELKKKPSYDELRKQLETFHVSDGFTVCYDFMLWHPSKEIILDILKPTGINCIFTPSASTTCPIIDGIRLETLPYFAINGVQPAPIKDILYSFMGIRYSSKLRDEIFSMNHAADTFIKESKAWLWPQGVPDYKDTLSRSRFSLCPKGFSSNTIRFYESLQAGAIPVLISDDAVLPSGIDWPSCIIRVPEENIRKIPEIIAAISLEQEQAMRQACRIAYTQCSGEHFVDVIEHYYNN